MIIVYVPIGLGVEGMTAAATNMARLPLTLSSRNPALEHNYCTEPNVHA